MRLLLILIVFLLLGCTDPVSPKSGPQSGKRKAQQCELAKRMIFHPADFDIDDPSGIAREGRYLWAVNGCGSDGKQPS